MKDKDIPITEIEEQSRRLDQLLFKRGNIQRSVDAKVFGLTKLDGERAEDSDSDPEALNDADLIFPNYLIGEDGKVLSGLNLNVEPAKHMKDLVKTKINCHAINQSTCYDHFSARVQQSFLWPVWCHRR